MGVTFGSAPDLKNISLIGHQIKSWLYINVGILGTVGGKKRYKLSKARSEAQCDAQERGGGISHWVIPHMYEPNKAFITCSTD